MDSVGSTKFGYTLGQPDVNVQSIITHYDESKVNSVGDALQFVFGFLVPAKLRTLMGFDVTDKNEVLRVLDNMQAEPVQVVMTDGYRLHHINKITHQVDAWPYLLEQSHSGFNASVPQYRITMTNQITGKVSEVCNGVNKELTIEGVQERFRTLLANVGYQWTSAAEVKSFEIPKAFCDLPDYFTQNAFYLGDYNCYPMLPHNNSEVNY